MTSVTDNTVSPWNSRPQPPAGWEEFCRRVLATAGGHDWPDEPVPLAIRRACFELCLDETSEDSALKLTDSLRAQVAAGDTSALISLSSRLRENTVLQRWLGEPLALIWIAAERGHDGARRCMAELFAPGQSRHVWFTPWYRALSDFPKLKALGETLRANGVESMRVSYGGEFDDGCFTQAGYALAVGPEAGKQVNVDLSTPGIEAKHPKIPWDDLGGVMFEQFDFANGPGGFGTVEFVTSASGHRIRLYANQGWGGSSGGGYQRVLLREDMEVPPSHPELANLIRNVMSDCRAWLLNQGKGHDWLCTCYELGELESQITFSGRWSGDPRREPVPTLDSYEHDWDESLDAEDSLSEGDSDSDESDESDVSIPEQGSEEQIAATCKREVADAGVERVEQAESSFYPEELANLHQCLMEVLASGGSGDRTDEYVSFGFHQPAAGPAYLSLNIKEGLAREIIEFEYPSITSA